MFVLQRKDKNVTRFVKRVLLLLRAWAEKRFECVVLILGVLMKTSENEDNPSHEPYVRASNYSGKKAIRQTNPFSL